MSEPADVTSVVIAFLVVVEGTSVSVGSGSANFMAGAVVGLSLVIASVMGTADVGENTVDVSKSLAPSVG